MSWSYDSSLAANKDKVRFLIDDTNTLDQLVTNEEIAFALGQWSNIYRAGSALCDTLALKFAKMVGISGGVFWDPSKQADKYRELAKTLKAQASETGGGGVFAGGISVATKQTQDEDTDRVAPSFSINQHDQLTDLDLSNRLDL